MRTDYKSGYEKAFEDFKKETETDNILMELWTDYAYRLTGFWYNKNGKQDYKVIVTKFDKGYADGLKDIELKMKVTKCEPEQRMTNLDRLRLMNSEELSRWMMGNCQYSCEPIFCQPTVGIIRGKEVDICPKEGNCRLCLQKWLESEETNNGL